MIDYFNVRTLQDTFRNDALEESPPMNQYIEHPDLVTGLFSQMTSAKGFNAFQINFEKKIQKICNF